MILYCVILLVIVFDQITKYLIRINMTLNQTIPIFDNIFHITYVRNYGAAFSILTGKQFFLIGATTVALISILVFIVIKKKHNHPMLSLSLSIIAGGGFGNLIDRIRLGYVVDFFDFRVFPIFNVADIFVCIGCGLLVIYLFFVEPGANKKKVA